MPAAAAAAADTRQSGSTVADSNLEMGIHPAISFRKWRTQHHATQAGLKSNVAARRRKRDSSCWSVLALGAGSTRLLAGLTSSYKRAEQLASLVSPDQAHGPGQAEAVSLAGMATLASVDTALALSRARSRADLEFGLHSSRTLCECGCSFMGPSGYEVERHGQSACDDERD